MRNNQVNLYICASVNRNANEEDLSYSSISGGLSVAHGADIIIRTRRLDNNIRADIVKHRRSGGMPMQESTFEFPIPVPIFNFIDVAGGNVEVGGGGGGGEGNQYACGGGGTNYIIGE